MRLVMIGPPASGKGTQGARLADRLSVPHVASGSLLRRSIAEGDPLGVGALVESGALVPDELVERLLFPALGPAFVLDGYPRTGGQATRLDGVLQERRLPLDAAVELLVDDGTLAERMRARFVQEARPDDRMAVFLGRVEKYRRAAESLRAHYASRLLEVDGVGDPDLVHARLLGALSAAGLPVRRAGPGSGPR